MISDKKIFITGGAGFIANALIKRIIEKNKITVFDNFHRDTLTSSGYLHHPNLTVIKGDVLNFTHVRDSMTGTDIVIHAAAIAGIDAVIKDPVKTMRVNLLGTVNVLEAAKLNHIVDRVIDFSTSEVFGQLSYKSAETDVTITGSAGEARWVYAISKLAGEHLGKAYFKQYQMPVVVVRPFNVYGPGQTGEGAMQIFIKSALKNEDIRISGEGNRIRAWCYVDDFIDGLLLCMEVPSAIGETFNIGNARAVITVLGLAQTICRILNSKSKILFGPDLSADVDLRIPSIEKSFELLRFKAKVDLEEGISRAAEWYISQNKM